MEWMLLPLKRYADFSGRSRRMEYWMFMLLYLAICAVLGVMGLVFGAFSSDGDSAGATAGFFVVMALAVVVLLALIIPSLAVQVRRFHDQNLSGWFVLLNFIPYLGGLVVLVFMILPGTRGPNRFGPDPLGETAPMDRPYMG